MSYLVMKSCFAAGKRRSAGDLIGDGDISAQEARELSAMGRIAKSASEPQEASMSDRSVGLDVSDAPAPKRRGRKPKNEG